MNLEEPKAVQEWLFGHRQSMLEAVRFYHDSDTPATPGKIRTFGEPEVPPGSFNNHMGQLESPPEEFDLPPLVEEVGRMDEGKGNPSRVFELTEAGKEFCEESDIVEDIGFDWEAIDSMGARLEDMETAVESHGQQISSLRETLGEKGSDASTAKSTAEENAERLDSVEEQLEDLDQRLSDMEDAVDQLSKLV